MADNGDIILYQSADGEPNIEVRLKNETVWLSQSQMAELFQTDQSGIARHIKNIFESGELDGKSNMQKLHIANADRPVNFYSLDVIISVGYRVNARRGVLFRIWATQSLREYIVKGFVMDDDRLSGKGNNYFEELLERVRKIRTSEANFYEKVKEIFTTSIDYDPKEDVAQLFFKSAQNKFHYAITGKTAAEIIVSNVNAFKPDMGLIHKKGKRVTKQEAEIAKNYLPEPDLKRLELLVEQFLSFAELQSLEQRPMYMKDWTRKLDEFIILNDKKVLMNAGSVSHDQMKHIVKEEFEVYQQKLLNADNDFAEDDHEKALRKTNRPKAGH